MNRGIDIRCIPPRFSVKPLGVALLGESPKTTSIEITRIPWLRSEQLYQDVFVGDCFTIQLYNAL